MIKLICLTFLFLNSQALATESFSDMIFDREIRVFDLRNKLLEKQKGTRGYVDPKAKQEAAEIYNQGRVLYDAENTKEALEKFRQAILIDATVDQYYFDYALCLYKLKMYKSSASMMGAIKEGEVNKVEADYYRALSLYKLNKLDEQGRWSRYC